MPASTLSPSEQRYAELWDRLQYLFAERDRETLQDLLDYFWFDDRDRFLDRSNLEPPNARVREEAMV